MFNIYCLKLISSSMLFLLEIFDDINCWYLVASDKIAQHA